MLEFFKRDFCITAAKLADYTVNYLIISPFIFNIGVGYLQAPLYFAHDPTAFCMRMLPGNLLILVMALTFRTAFDLLFDLENNKFISYQITLLNPRLILVERVIFGTVYTFCSVAPFFLIAKISLGQLFNTTATSWPAVFLVTLAGSFCCAAYHLLAICFISTKQVSMLWIRVNFFIIMLARLPIPIQQAKSYSALLSCAMYASPIGYFVEGINRALTGDERFFPLIVSISILCLTGIACTVISWFVFKKRIDHV